MVGSGQRARPVIVIGAGHNGLCAAIELARAGLEVVVLEASDSAGCAVASSEDTVPGFVHDRGSGFFPMTLASPVMRALPLDRHGVCWVNPRVAMAHPFLERGAIALDRDVDRTAADLDRLTPGDGEAWRRLVLRLVPQRERLFAALLSTFPPIAPGLGLTIRLRRDGVELFRRALGSAVHPGGGVHGVPGAGAARALMRDRRRRPRGRRR